MKNLPAVGTRQTLHDGGRQVDVLAHGKLDGMDIAICQDGPKPLICTADAFKADAPDYKGHENLAEMIKNHITNWRDALECARCNGVTVDDMDYWDHEMKALDDIEAAVKAELA